jgi:hypothetical protein
MKRWLVTLAAVAIAASARAQDETQPPPPPPETKPKLLLGGAGESCRTSDDCAGGLGCIAGACGSRAPKPEEKKQSPVEHYRTLSFSLLSDAGAAFSFQSGQDLAALDLGASLRIVVQGFVIGAQVSVVYEKATGGTAFEIGAVEPGIALGYAFPVSERVAITPSARALFFVPFTNTGTSANFGEFTGEVAATCFLGTNGFIEPYIAAGDYQLFSGGSAEFLFTFGYRLGVVF